ncbi:MAG: tyrosine--tRNA ligase, partial [Gemmatimonadetes bacterium]|nr:tyrosine--tRNA ligase [Gemmatimonadota bacterium]
MSHFIEDLHWRGMLYASTEGAAEHLAEGRRAAYIGFDPTAPSLHIGSLLPIMSLVHFQRAGHVPIGLVGGGTGLIGDPSGRTAERQLLTKEEAAENAEGIRRQLEHFLDFEVKSNPARMANNLVWRGGLALVDFLRDVGKHFSVNQLLARESVKRRLENEETGISYTEFSYALLQSYDFLELYRREGCTVQMGGSDQWGNITAGTDLIRRMAGGKAYGVVFPLVTTPSGTKFGKTEAGNVWLDPALTSPFRFYQYWVNADDADVVRYLRFFSLRSREEIEGLGEAVKAAPQAREAQRALAEEVTRRLHGETGLARARKATEVLFGGEIEGMGAEEVADVFSDVPSSTVPRASFEGEGMSLVELLAVAGVATSKGDARRAIEGGGIYLNNRRVVDVAHTVRATDAIEGRFLVVRKGKRSYHLVALAGCPSVPPDGAVAPGPERRRGAPIPGRPTTPRD